MVVTLIWSVSMARAYGKRIFRFDLRYDRDERKGRIARNRSGKT